MVLTVVLLAALAMAVATLIVIIVRGQRRSALETLQLEANLEAAEKGRKTPQVYIGPTPGGSQNG